MFRGFTKPRNHSTLRAAQNVQFVIQKARHDQKVYALPFSCQLVRSGRRSLSVLCLRRFPLLVQGVACSLWRLFAGFGSACDVSIVCAE